MIQGLRQDLDPYIVTFPVSGLGWELLKYKVTRLRLFVYLFLFRVMSTSWTIYDGPSLRPFRRPLISYYTVLWIPGSCLYNPS